MTCVELPRRYRYFEKIPKGNDFSTTAIAKYLVRQIDGWLLQRVTANIQVRVGWSTAVLLIALQWFKEVNTVF